MIHNHMYKHLYSNLQCIFHHFNCAQLVNGYVHYIHPKKTVILDKVRIHDGKWHYLEIRWLPGKQFLMTLDYGEIQVCTSWWCY